MEIQFFQGVSGLVYQLQEHAIASGGEGEIYKIVNHPDQVAKIFKEKQRTHQREEKLLKMIQIHLEEDQLSQVTWPQDVIYSQNGFAGYIMPMLKGNKSLNSVYAVNGREQDYRKRVLIAYNLCVAVDVIHSQGQVCGDMNPQNICVNEKTGHVTLVDTDSFHFYDMREDITYRCEVGLADYIAPEVQNKLSENIDLKTAPLPTYTKQTDLFALAVHIFALLMNGCHPFACAKDQGGRIENQMEQMTDQERESVVLPQPIDNIKQGFFPFHQKKEYITYPLYSPDFTTMPDYMRMLFIQTFEEGYLDPKKRVSAKEWQKALRRFASEGELIQCAEQHWYSSQQIGRCPWCAMQERLRDAMWEMMGEVDPLVYTSEQNASSSTGTGYGHNTSTNSRMYGGVKSYTGFSQKRQSYLKVVKAEIWGELQVLICVAAFFWIMMTHEDISVVLTFFSKLEIGGLMEESIFIMEWIGILGFSLLCMYLLSGKGRKYFKTRILTGSFWFVLGIEMWESAAIHGEIEVAIFYALVGIVFWVTAIVMLSKGKVSPNK